MLSSKASHWINIISTYDKEFKKWEARVEAILKRYRDDRATRHNTQAKFNILWANVQTVVPAVFSKLPKPDVSRRFSDNDPVGRVASLMLERSLSFEIEHYPDYEASLKNSVFDRFLGGRGIAWVRYEPHFKMVEKIPEEGFQITEDIESDYQPEMQEELKNECCPVDYVHWRDFGHSIARTWEEVTVVWRKVYMNRPALVKRFGEELGNKIPLDTRPEDLKRNSSSTSDGELYQACIIELWDKENEKALWISRSFPDVLDERDDPLELENFWPCPKPLFATLTTDSLIPVPDFVLYQDQADELNILCDRIDGLVKALQVKGVYDASIPELQRILTEGQNNSLIPVKNWAAFSEKQGLKGAIDLIDIQPLALALMEAYKAMEQIKGQIYEITGLSDIIRGQTDASETAKAQQMKGNYSSMRLRHMQSDVAKFATELLQIKAQIICKFFQKETILKISGASQLTPQDQQLIPQALELLKNEPLRNFRIEISSDSMIQMDEQQEKEARLEFLKSTSMFMQQALPAAQSSPEMVPILMALLRFGVTAFKVGKTIEGQFDEFEQKMVEASKQPKETPPNPDIIKIQMESQSRQQEMQMKFNLEQQSSQIKMQLEQHKQEVQAQQIMNQNQLEAQRESINSNNEKQLEMMRFENDKLISNLEEQTKLIIANINNIAKIEVAEIQSNAQLQSSQINSAEGFNN